VVDESEEHRRLIDQRTVQDDQGPCWDNVHSSRPTGIP
jgi:hypothetical protein